jgi:hypothetical protein
VENKQSDRSWVRGLCGVKGRGDGQPSGLTDLLCFPLLRLRAGIAKISVDWDSVTGLSGNTASKLKISGSGMMIPKMRRSFSTRREWNWSKSWGLRSPWRITKLSFRQKA